MSGVRQIGNTKYQVYTVFKQNVKRHCEAWKKQYGIKVYCPKQDALSLKV